MYHPVENRKINPVAHPSWWNFVLVFHLFAHLLGLGPFCQIQTDSQRIKVQVNQTQTHVQMNNPVRRLIYGSDANISSLFHRLAAAWAAPLPAHRRRPTRPSPCGTRCGSCSRCRRRNPFSRQGPYSIEKISLQIQYLIQLQ